MNFNSIEISSIPATPPNACYKGCTLEMKSLLTKFNAASAPDLSPAVYSGRCYDLASNLNPNQVQYGMAMFDHNDQNGNLPYFATMFSFYSGQDDWAKWDLKTARTQIDVGWKSFGRLIITASKTSHVAILDADGNYSMIYWFRQNSRTGTLYQITYWGGNMESFCELKKH